VDGLNAQQRQAVMHQNGPCLVLAGAGSGKTRVLTMRAARLIAEGVRPERILMFTFTRKAAEEMRKRLGSLAGEERAESVWIGTFHSVCLRILKMSLRDAGWSDFDILTEHKAIRLARDILAPPDEDNPYGMSWSADPKILLARISRAKADLADVSRGERHLRENTELDDFNIEQTLEFWRRYEDAKQNAVPKRLLDFDDLLLHTYRMFVEHPNILRHWQNRWDYILEDEVQDTNIAQHEICRMLAAEHRNYFCVGDVQQSIYGFRGSRPDRTVMSFERDYPEGTIIKLPVNYRSDARIVELGARLIRHGSIPALYSLIQTPHRPAETEPVFDVASDEDDEAERIARTILQYKYDGGMSWQDMAVLYRVNAQSRAIEDAMVRHDIPYVVHGSCGFYDRKEVRDVTAFLQLAHNPHSDQGDEALERVINIPTGWFIKHTGKSTHFLGQAFLRDLRATAARHGCSMWKALSLGNWKQWQWDSIYDFVDFVDAVRRSGPAPNTMIAAVREKGYDEWLMREEGGVEDDDDGTRFENLDQLAYVAQHFENAGALLDFVTMQRSRSGRTQEGADVVHLLTLHRAKGLEWPAVFVCGLSLGLLPHRRSVKYYDPDTRRHIIPESIEEERRLCYVGVTRAMRFVHLSYLRRYQGYELAPSPFVKEMGFDLETTDNEEQAKQEAWRQIEDGGVQNG